MHLFPLMSERSDPLYCNLARLQGNLVLLHQTDVPGSVESSLKLYLNLHGGRYSSVKVLKIN